MQKGRLYFTGFLSSASDKVINDREVEILAFHLDLDVIFLKVWSKLFSYHLVTFQVEEIGNVEPDCAWWWFIYVPCYSRDVDRHSFDQVFLLLL